MVADRIRKDRGVPASESESAPAGNVTQKSINLKIKEEVK
jgi:hypothetical protein